MQDIVSIVDYEKLMDTEVAGYCLHCRIREVNGYRSCRILSPLWSKRGTGYRRCMLLLTVVYTGAEFAGCSVHSGIYVGASPLLSVVRGMN